MIKRHNLKYKRSIPKKMNAVLREKIMEKYPQGVYAGSINSEKGQTTAILSGVIPRLIIDNKNEKQYVKFLKLANLGKITVNKEKKIGFQTQRKIVEKRMTEGINQIKNKTEQIVLSSIYDKLIKIAMIRTQLNPIYIILKEVYEGGFQKSSLNKLGSKKDKYQRYLKFLCDLEILREQSSKYSEGNYYIEVRDALAEEDSELVISKMFGLAITEGKTYLLNNLNLNVLKPFIRISNVYYMNSALSENLLSINKQTLLRQYEDTYGLRVNELKFDSHVSQLSDAGILQEGDFITGDQEVLNDVRKKFSSAAA